MLRKSSWWALALCLGGAADARANCSAAGPGSLVSIKTLCTAAETLGLPFTCLGAKDECKWQSNKVFTGATIELASPGNIKTWNGRGSMGRDYAFLAVCTLRDLHHQPMVAPAKTDTIAGEISFSQEVGFLTYTPGLAPSVRGYQRATACLPVLGCLDGFTQEFTVGIGESTDTAGKGAGEYAIQKLHFLNVGSDFLDQALALEGPKIPVPTPFGEFEVIPRFHFSRHAEQIVRPYHMENVRSLLSPAAHVTDVLGPSEGLSATAVPAAVGKTGWLSQVGLGGRAAEGALWTPGAEMWPVRPDAEIQVARSPAERILNVSASAEIEVAYDLLGLFPPAQALQKSGLLGDSALKVSVTPSLAYRGSTQWNLWNGEVAEWISPTEVPPQKPSLGDLDQFRLLGVYGGASVAGAFRIDLGIDLVLKIDPPVLDDITLFEHHRGARVVDAEAKPKAAGWLKQVVIGSQLKQILAGQPFTTYQTLTETPSPKAHLAACSQKPPDGVLPGITWKEGDPQDLLEHLLYPCNICVHWPPGTYQLEDGTTQSYEGFTGVIVEVEQPKDKRWSCDLPDKLGCYDLCSGTSLENLTVTETAIELEDRGVGRAGCDAAIIN